MKKEVSDALHFLLHCSLKDTRFTTQKEQFDIVYNEIERLTELCNKYEEEHKTTFETWQKDIKENEQLHSIIKEVREYIEELAEDTEDYIGAIDRRRKVELLEILKCSDKVENDIEFDVLKALNTDLDDDVEMG